MPPDHGSGGHKNGTISKIMKISKFLLYCLFPITQWSFCIFSLNSDQWFERRCHLMCPSECFGIKLQKCHNFQSIGKTKLPFCMVCSPSSKDASVKVSLNLSSSISFKEMLMTQDKWQKKTGGRWHTQNGLKSSPWHCQVS